MQTRGSCNAGASSTYGHFERHVVMSQQNRRSQDPGRRMGLSFLALLLVPLLLFLHAPVLAAIVPGALITVASLDVLQHRERHALTGAAVVDPEDRDELQRVSSATPIEASSRRIA
jgi:hypothetical protein